MAAARLLNDIFRTRNCKKVRQYIKKGYDCNGRRSEAPHSSLLHLVASLTCIGCDKGSAAQKMIKEGAEVDARDDNNLTPLMVCAIHGNDRMAAALIQAGADVHAVCNQQETALHWAAENNCAAVVQLLLAAGASASALYVDGALPLHYACTHGTECDLQLIKPPLFRGIDSCLQTLAILPGALAGLSFRPENIHLDPGIYAAAAANALVSKEGIPFREAYRRVAAQIKDSE